MVWCAGVRLVSPEIDLRFERWSCVSVWTVVGKPRHVLKIKRKPDCLRKMTHGFMTANVQFFWLSLSLNVRLVWLTLSQNKSGRGDGWRRGGCSGCDDVMYWVLWVISVRIGEWRWYVGRRSIMSLQESGLLCCSMLQTHISAVSSPPQLPNPSSQ